MDEQQLARARMERRRTFHGATALAFAGLVGMVGGFIVGRPADGDVATAAGVLAGVSFSFFLIGAVVAWRNRPGDAREAPEPVQGKRDRLQAQRSSQLFLFPVVAVIFLALSLDSVRDVAAGEGGFRDWLSISLPVLYAWLTTAIAMGWDVSSRRNRRFLEDELTVSLRARAMTAAFLVLMVGATVALVLGLTRPELGIMAVLGSIAAAGATAGVRFAWLDREAGRDE